jgi:hypothetical protein
MQIMGLALLLTSGKDNHRSPDGYIGRAGEDILKIAGAGLKFIKIYKKSENRRMQIKTVIFMLRVYWQGSKKRRFIRICAQLLG